MPAFPSIRSKRRIPTSLEERQVGGLGIYLCKQLMDHIEYKYEDGCNILLMKKKVA